MCGVECGGVMFKWWTTIIFYFKLLKNFSHGGLGKELRREVPWIEDAIFMIKDQNKWLVEKNGIIFFSMNFSFGEKICKNYKVIRVWSYN
jgi:hypothetical protein